MPVLTRVDLVLHFPYSYVFFFFADLYCAAFNFFVPGLFCCTLPVVLVVWGGIGCEAWWGSKTTPVYLVRKRVWQILIGRLLLVLIWIHTRKIIFCPPMIINNNFSHSICCENIIDIKLYVVTTVQRDQLPRVCGNKLIEQTKTKFSAI